MADVSRSQPKGGPSWSPKATPFNIDAVQLKHDHRGFASQARVVATQACSLPSAGGIGARDANEDKLRQLSHRRECLVSKARELHHIVWYQLVPIGNG